MDFTFVNLQLKSKDHLSVNTPHCSVYVTGAIDVGDAHFRHKAKVNIKKHIIFSLLLVLLTRGEDFLF